MFAEIGFGHDEQSEQIVLFLIQLRKASILIRHFSSSLCN